MMADVDRKAKIAAARKKLKQIKQSGTSQPATDGVKTTSSNAVVSEGSGERRRSPVEDDTNGFIKDPSSSLTMKFQPSFPQMNAADQNRQPHTASTERLHLLSRQVTGLVNESSAYVNGEVSGNGSGLDYLERRNQELAILLENQTQMSSQLSIQVDELKHQNVKLQHSLESERKTFEEKLKKDLGALKEQLQVHIQTIGILVAEKTELQSSYNQSQKTAEARQSEIEELSGRLKASRQRVTDLERNISTASSSNQKIEKANKEMAKELDKLKTDLYKLNKLNEDGQQHNLELQGKLQQKISESSRLEDQLIELKGRLEMSELHVQQLQNGQDRPDPNLTRQIEKLIAENSELATKLQQQEESLRFVRQERDALTEQYQSYIDQLQQQARSFQIQVDSLVNEKDLETQRCKEIEASLAQLKLKQAEATDDRLQDSEEKTQMQETIEKLNAHLAAMSKNLEVQVADNSQLSRLIIEKEQRIVEMEMMMERESDSAVNQEKLLETMQSDKTALSRAIAQNRELKVQLAELQGGFVKMSTENMEMMTQLQGEQHIAKELAARLGHQEEELKELRHQLDEKEYQLQNIERQDAERAASHRHELSSEEMAQRIQEFQQQSPLVENLQRELSSAQDTVNALTNQNSNLKSRVIQLETTSSHLSPDDSSSRDQIDSMSASITQLEMERDQVLDQLRDSHKLQQALKDKIQDIQHDLASQVPATMNGDVVTKVHFEALQHAMQQLEEKYTRVMRDKADLVDKSERLEHIIMQLQGETDTIGEYVSLYQQQRSILRQRTAEKDGYIYQLAHERIEMQQKLGELQALVMQLLNERNMLHSFNGNVPTPELGSTHPAKNHPHKHHHAKRTNVSSEDGTNDGTTEDWPDYTESSSESEVEEIIASNADGSPNENGVRSESWPPSDRNSQHLSSPHIPVEGQTAQRIMDLLSQIGTSNLVDAFDSRHFVHCGHCSGQLIVV